MFAFLSRFCRKMHCMMTTFRKQWITGRSSMVGHTIIPNTGGDLVNDQWRREVCWPSARETMSTSHSISSAVAVNPVDSHMGHLSGTVTVRLRGRRLRQTSCSTKYPYAPTSRPPPALFCCLVLLYVSDKTCVEVCGGVVKSGRIRAGFSRSNGSSAPSVTVTE